MSESDRLVVDDEKEEEEEEEVVLVFPPLSNESITNLVLCLVRHPAASREKVRFRLLQFAGYCFRSLQLVSDSLFWKPAAKFRSGQGSL